MEREVKEKGVAVIQEFTKVSNFTLGNTKVTNKLNLFNESINLLITSQNFCKSRSYFTLSPF